MTTDRPKIPNIPGVKWRKYSDGQWEARWKPRADLVERGYLKSTARLWIGHEATELDVLAIRSRAGQLQSDMLMFANGGAMEAGLYDEMFSGLVRCYLLDPDSPYRSVEYASRQQYDKLCKRIVKDIGNWEVAKTNIRAINQQHQTWRNDSGVAMAHALISMMRMLTGFGATATAEEKRGLVDLANQVERRVIQQVNAAL
jgi:hypothetical protein